MKPSDLDLEEEPLQSPVGAEFPNYIDSDVVFVERTS